MCWLKLCSHPGLDLVPVDGRRSCRGPRGSARARGRSRGRSRGSCCPCVQPAAEVDELLAALPADRRRAAARRAGRSPSRRAGGARRRSGSGCWPPSARSRRSPGPGSAARDRWCNGTWQFGHRNCAPVMITLAATPPAAPERSTSARCSTSSTVPRTMSPSTMAIPSTTEYCTPLVANVAPAISPVRTSLELRNSPRPKPSSSSAGLRLRPPPPPLDSAIVPPSVHSPGTRARLPGDPCPKNCSSRRLCHPSVGRSASRPGGRRITL